MNRHFLELANRLQDALPSVQSCPIESLFQFLNWFFCCCGHLRHFGKFFRVHLVLGKNLNQRWQISNAIIFHCWKWPNIKIIYPTDHTVRFCVAVIKLFLQRMFSHFIRGSITVRLMFIFVWMLNWKQIYLFVWLNPNESNRRSTVQWCFNIQSKWAFSGFC